MDVSKIFQPINVYIDESRHNNDNDGGYMLLGAVWLDVDQLPVLNDAVRLIKKKYDILTHREIKWTKVSTAKLDYYKEIIQLFLQLEQVNYRAVIIDKSKLDYESHGKTRESFYYTMQYILVRNIAEKRFGHIRLFLDYKDAWSGKYSHELAEYLNNTGSLHHKSLTAQPLRSHEVVGLQIADLITGAVMYASKPQSEQKSESKMELVRLLEKSTEQKLTESTPYGLEKFNLLFWEPKR